jgi:hypothetical protein
VYGSNATGSNVTAVCKDEGTRGQRRTNQRSIAKFCGLPECEPMLNWECGALKGGQGCMACALNGSSYEKQTAKKKPYKVTLCNETQRERFCGPKSVMVCNRTLSKVCGKHRGSTQCMACVQNKTNAPGFAQAGCIKDQTAAFCEMDSVCNRSLVKFCGADCHAANCSECVLKPPGRASHEMALACKESLRFKELFCDSCQAMLQSACARSIATGNSTECMQCIHNITLKKNLIYSSCTRQIEDGFCKIPPPAPPTPTPVTCNWAF